MKHSIVSPRLRLVRRIQLSFSLLVLGWISQAGAATALGANARDADKKPSRIEVGQAAPDFVLKNEQGKEFKLSEFLKTKKKAVLLAFYPKDFTGG